MPLFSPPILPKINDRNCQASFRSVSEREGCSIVSRVSMARGAEGGGSRRGGSCEEGPFIRLQRQVAVRLTAGRAPCIRAWVHLMMVIGTSLQEGGQAFPFSTRLISSTPIPGSSHCVSHYSRKNRWKGRKNRKERTSARRFYLLEKGRRSLQFERQSYFTENKPVFDGSKT